MDSRTVARLLGHISLLMGALMLFPIGVAFYYAEPDGVAFLKAMALAFSVGMGLVGAAKQPRWLGAIEAYAVVTLGWLLAAALGALPLFWSGAIPNYADAFFEAMSGLTTTGATVIPVVEEMTHAILFWRALLHWVGGMGIILLFITVFPGLGAGGFHLFRAEVPGYVPERIEPRISGTALRLWLIYTGLTVAEIVMLCAAGMDLFDAVAHSFATMATGGFSTKTTSVGAWSNPAIRMIVVGFMVLAGGNFGLYYRLLQGRPAALLRDEEFRVYLGIIGSATALVSLDLLRAMSDNVWDTLQQAVFQVTSMMTTTGFATADFDHWPPLSRAVLGILMFIGGCTGSTAGAIKVGRLLIAARHARRELRAWATPSVVTSVKMNGVVVRGAVLHSVLGFVALYATVFGVSTMFMAWLGLDLISASTAVAATLGNVGPGLGIVGPSVSYAPIAESGKWVLSACMLLGRLEIYTVLSFVAGIE